MAGPEQGETLTQEQQVHLMLLRFQAVGDFLGVARPQASEAGGRSPMYTQAYGQQVRDALQARVGDLDNPDSARLSDTAATFSAGMRQLNMLEPLNFTGNVDGLGEYLKTIDEQVDDTMSVYTDAELNTIFYSVQDARAAAAAVPAAPAEPQPDRTLSAQVVADNRLVQGIFAQAIRNAKGEGDFFGASMVPTLLSANGADASALPNMTVSANGQWTDESLAALNGIVDMLKGPAGIEGTASGYQPGMADQFTAAFAGMDAGTKAVLDQIISAEDRTRVLAALERLAQANELRPVEMVTVAPAVEPPAAAPAVEPPAAAPAVEPPAAAADGTAQPASGAVIREVSPDVVANNRIVQERIAAAIGAAQSPLVSGLLQAQGVDTASLPAMTRTDGQWDAQSLSSLNALVDMLKGPAGLADQYPDSGYQAGMAADFRAAFTRLQQEDAAKYTVLNTIISEADREALLNSLESLAAADELRPTVESSAAAGPAQAAPAVAARPAMTVEEATQNVELTLKLFGDTLQEMTGAGAGGLAGMAASIGVDISTIFDPLTDADLSDGRFGQRSQDMAAFTIMALKKLDGQENPTGEYNAAIGENLQLSILTKPEFAQVREALGLSFYGDAGGIDGDRAELARQLLLYERGLEEPPPGSNDAIMQQYQQQLAQRQQFEQLHAREIQELRTMTSFFQGMTVLEQNNEYNNEQARQTSEYNTYLTLAGDLMDQYAPGLKAWLQDFLQNSQIGQMLAGFLGMQGINVARLWGDTNDAAAVENAAPLVGEKFDEYYTAAMRAEGVDPNDHSAVIAQVRAEIDEDLNGGNRVEQWLRNKGLEVVFRGVEQEDIHAAINQALDRADAAGNRDAARQAFVDSMVASAEVLRVTGELDPARVEEEMQRLRTEAQAVEQANPEAAAAAAAVSAPVDEGRDAAPAAVVEEGHDDAAGGADIAEETRSVLADTDPAAAAAGAPQTEVVGQRTTGIGLEYDEDMGPYPQLTRWANDRVAPIADVFERNYDAMKFSAQPVGVLQGQKYMTTEFIGFVEEAFVRAQIDEHLNSEGGTLDNLDVSTIDHKFDGAADLDTVLNYMLRQGVDVDDVRTVSANIASLDNDFRSPNAPGGGDHRFSVWDHSNALNAYTRDGERVGISRDGDVFANAGQIDVALIVEEIRREIEPPPAEPEPPVEVIVEEEQPEPYVATVPLEDRHPNDLFEYQPPPQQVQCAPVETFDHLARVADQADGNPNVNVEGELNARLAEALPSVADASAQTVTDPLKVMLQAGFARLPGDPSMGIPKYAMLRPSDFGVNVEGVDLVVAYSPDGGQTMDIRYVNYERDGIRPIEQHNRSDFNESYDPQDTINGDRRLDDVLFIHRRHAGDGTAVPGAQYGYRHVGMVGAVDGITGYGRNSAFNAIYGARGMDESRYHQGFNLRSERLLRVEHAMNAGPGDKSRAFEVQGCSAVMPRGQFTDAVGHAPEAREIYPTTRRVLGPLANSPLGALMLPVEELLRRGPGFENNGASRQFPQSEGWQGYHPHYERMMVEQMRDLGMTDQQIEAQMEERLGRDYNSGLFR